MIVGQLIWVSKSGENNKEVSKFKDSATIENQVDRRHGSREQELPLSTHLRRNFHRKIAWLRHILHHPFHLPLLLDLNRFQAIKSGRRIEGGERRMLLSREKVAAVAAANCSAAAAATTKLALLYCQSPGRIRDRLAIWDLGIG